MVCKVFPHYPPLSSKTNDRDDNDDDDGDYGDDDDDGDDATVIRGFLMPTSGEVGILI